MVPKVNSALLWGRADTHIPSSPAQTYLPNCCSQVKLNQARSFISPLPAYKGVLLGPESPPPQHDVSFIPLKISFSEQAIFVSYCISTVNPDAG